MIFISELYSEDDLDLVGQLLGGDAAAVELLVGQTRCQLVHLDPVLLL